MNNAKFCKALGQALISMANAGTWDESKHPRAADGKFGSGGGAVEAEKRVSQRDDVFATELRHDHPVKYTKPGKNPTWLSVGVQRGHEEGGEWVPEDATDRRYQEKVVKEVYKTIHGFEPSPKTVSQILKTSATSEAAGDGVEDGFTAHFPLQIRKSVERARAALRIRDV